MAGLALFNATLEWFGDRVGVKGLTFQVGSWSCFFYLAQLWFRNYDLWPVFVVSVVVFLPVHSATFPDGNRDIRLSRSRTTYRHQAFPHRHRGLQGAGKTDQNQKRGAGWPNYISEQKYSSIQSITLFNLYMSWLVKIRPTNGKAKTIMLWPIGRTGKKSQKKSIRQREVSPWIYHDYIESIRSFATLMTFLQRPQFKVLFR